MDQDWSGSQIFLNREINTTKSIVASESTEYILRMHKAPIYFLCRRIECSTMEKKSQSSRIVVDRTGR